MCAKVAQFTLFSLHYLAKILYLHCVLQLRFYRFLTNSLCLPSFIFFLNLVLVICPASQAKMLWIFINERLFVLFLFFGRLRVGFVVILQNIHTVNVEVMRIRFDCFAFFVTVDRFPWCKLLITKAAMTIDYVRIIVKIH